MKKISCFIFLFGFRILTYGQVKKLEIPVYKNGERTLWYKWQQENVAKTGLSDLTKSSDSLHFRFATETQIVDISTVDFKKFDGAVYNFTKKYNAVIGGYDTTKIFMNKKKLKHSAAYEIYTFFENGAIFEIPSEEDISGWGKGMDGISYIIEYSTPSHYSLKSYWTPEMFRYQLKEANKIYTLADQLESNLDLRYSFQTFINHLPKGCYSAGGIATACNENIRK